MQGHGCCSHALDSGDVYTMVGGYSERDSHSLSEVKRDVTEAMQSMHEGQGDKGPCSPHWLQRAPALAQQGRRQRQAQGRAPDSLLLALAAGC